MEDSKVWRLDVAIHRRILRFVNAARRPEELMKPPPHEVLILDERVMMADVAAHRDEGHAHDDDHEHEHDDKKKPVRFFDRALAKRILRERDDNSPLDGFRHIKELQKIPGFDRAILDRLIRWFSPRYRGKWEVMYADAD